MCGIAGAFSTESENLNERDISAMCEAIAHRGPDGQGIHIRGQAALGHRRLAILDLTENGRQPMRLGDRYAITYNGEIYNYLELRKELEALGHPFHTGTDTEVLLHAYTEWGIDCLRRFNGMFSFALVDFETRRVFMARDRLGVKPLYYFRDAQTFVFASEIKALWKHPRVRKEANRDYCARYLTGGPREWERETAFSGVYRILNGHYVEGTIEDVISGRAPERRYWNLEADPSDEPFDAAKGSRLAEEYLALLDSAVDLRLRSDVPVGSAFSGGLDSSSVVWLINRKLRATGSEEKQMTFSSVYQTAEARDCDESRFIESLVGSLRLNSHSIEPKVEDVAEAHRAVLYHLDTPPDSTIMSSWHVFKLVAQTPVKVTLDGQGADEQLAGYTTYVLNHFFASKSTAPEALKFWHNPQIRRHVLAGSALSATARILGRPAAVRFAGTLKRVRPYLEPLNERLARDTTTYLLNLIHYADRYSMAHSIESRGPFLDYRLVEFLGRTPAVYKIHDGWAKYLARKAFDGKLPADLVWRKDKMGWPNPERYWFTGPLRGWFTDRVRSSEFLGSLADVSDIERRLDSNEPMVGLVRYLNLATWHDIFLR